MNPTRSFLIAIAVFSVVLLAGAQTKPAMPVNGVYTIVIHGGAGTISESMPDSVKKKYYESLSHALQIGKEILAAGGTSMDAAEKVVNYFEVDPKFNAGIGSVFTSDGTHEMDAAIMDGRDLSCGSIAGVQHIPHPISLARLVKEKTPHVMLAGEGAERFAQSMGIKLVPGDYFDTPERKHQLEQYKKKIAQGKHGTVGCVALDMHGNLAAATSTGGMTGKMPGRIGDAPLIGDGTYANNSTCAVSCTGWGEKFIRNTVAFNISALMEYKGMTLAQAADEMIYHRLQPDDGGLIAVDAKGNYAMPFNSSGMFRGVATSTGVFEVKIWK
ncbi:MAG TPA: isoaspartyl peptidase/L-asparaginase [Bacteroidota bacterium]|nr:isoaspartyl peptidase/L-asparaginase [Bacteroidota bacterium]